MIIDTSFFTELYYAENDLNYYDDIMDYMKQFSKEFYTRLNIYVERHHILPSFECQDLDKEEEIWLPVSIHFKAHYLRALEKSITPNTEYEQWVSIGNYTEAYCILKRFPQLQKTFEKEYELAEHCHVNFFKAKTYEAQFGSKKANKIKRKISLAMSNLNPLIISARNDKIAEYASNRPQSHNDAIAKAKTKSVINVTLNKIYSNIEEASKESGISKASIYKCCQRKVESVKGIQWEYLI